ncbi:MAG: hypothetical protein NVSMB4_00140 [Acidimicrobiales bacterium]
MLRIEAPALTHGCTREDVSHAYDLAVFDKVLDEDADPPKFLVIGPDSAGNLLELIGGEFEGGDVIWHAMPCRKQYLDLLPRRGGKQ